MSCHTPSADSCRLRENPLPALAKPHHPAQCPRLRPYEAGLKSRSFNTINNILRFTKVRSRREGRTEEGSSIEHPPLPHSSSRRTFSASLSPPKGRAERSEILGKHSSNRRLRPYGIETQTPRQSPSSDTCRKSDHYGIVPTTSHTPLQAVHLLPLCIVGWR